MNSYKLDLEKYAALARQAVAEGCVLLENEGQALPLRDGERVAVFGRMAFHYYKSGLGSGGLVNTRYVMGILDALKECEGVYLDEKLMGIYEDWIMENPYDEGQGWGHVPWCQKEMDVTEEMLDCARRNDVSLVVIGRTAGEDQDNNAKAGSYCLTETEEEALARLKQMREQYWDATHNVYAYIIRDGATRFSDDGEPGGTAGMPVLQVLQREELYNVTCVVTRYFGGILLGAGGLVRAYAHGAKIAVDAAGRSIKRIWTNVYLPCPYSWYERIRLEVAAFGGMIRETQFGADVELDLLLPEEQTQGFLERVTDLSAGTIEGLIGKQEYRAFPLP